MKKLLILLLLCISISLSGLTKMEERLNVNVDMSGDILVVKSNVQSVYDAIYQLSYIFTFFEEDMKSKKINGLNYISSIFNIYFNKGDFYFYFALLSDKDRSDYILNKVEKKSIGQKK